MRGQDVSKEILSDLVRKNVAEFSDKFSHFQYATLEVFKGALNNYFELLFKAKIRFLNKHPHSLAMYLGLLNFPRATAIRVRALENENSVV